MTVGWTLCQNVDWTFEIDVTWTSFSEYFLTRKEAILPEMKQNRKSKLVCLKFYEGIKIEKGSLKVRHWNTIFTKMSRLQNGIWYYVHMMLTM